jgi:threonine aldolase
MRMFRNDYSEGAAPQILDALVRTNDEQCVGYTEGDPHCERARALIRAEVGRDDVDVEFCCGGTSANVIGVTGMLRDWEGVVCTRDAHINVHETGAIAACGRTVLATADTNGFLSPDEAERVWQFQTSTGRHMTRPAVAYITNSTEIGGVWTRARFDAICDWARSHDLKVFLDGARLGSALTSSESDLTLRHIARNVSAFYLGGTKNGMLFGEAMVIADPMLKEAFPYLVKERGGLMAKGRLLGVQFEAAFEPDGAGNANAAGTAPGEKNEALYWRLARHANSCAYRLRDGLLDMGFKPFGHSASNQQFFQVTPEQERALADAAGCETFYVLDDGTRVVRFVTSWATTEADVDELLSFAETL